jgi:hypothetical protein
LERRKLKLNNMKKTIIEFVFGKRAKGEKLTSPTVRTLHIQERPSENEWLKEFRCSMLHNKKAVYIS